MLLDKFKAKAEAVNSEVHRFATKAETLHFIMSFLQKEGVADLPGAYAVWADSPFLRRIQKEQLAFKVPGLKFDVTCETAASAKIGISEMDWAIADTGTLVQDSTDLSQRMASSLPEIHIALIESHRIELNMVFLLKKISLETTPYLAFITGPSRNADIKRGFTIGAHGPERLVIVFVDEVSRGR
jgi:L-lactate dehydrogenase complex protein LldG